MTPYDVKRDLRHLYAPRTSDVEFVDVPPLPFLLVAGRGDPNTAPAYREAVEALYTASYAVRAVAKARAGRVHVVAPLEGLWSAGDLRVFHTRDKAAWKWTMMITQPAWVTADVVAEALLGARGKRLPGLDRLRLETRTEGRCVQVLHVGPYDAEGPTIARLHDELSAHGLVPTGPHHEVYLSDPRRTDPARLRTILRQPVAHASSIARNC